MNGLNSKISQPINPTSGVPVAIYTRKSHENGLEQEFNSLHAQYESCKAYILSQAHLDWKFAKHYEDSAISGGTLNRPALQELLLDIKAGKIQCIVVYKIDRLSRSLFDFAKLVEVFEEHNVSFVSITQSFNTANAMGKLMLNVLLSFAQFEREVTSERIKDKFYASRKKGLWISGYAPLGYHLVDGKLIVNKAEIDQVKFIFNKYLEINSLYKTCHVLNELGYRRKVYLSKAGEYVGGSPFDGKALYRLLTNVAYIGKVSYKEEVFDGQQEAIMSDNLFNRVQNALVENNNNTLGKTQSKINLLLRSRFFTADNEPFKITFSVKDGKRYYYYYNSQKRLIARHVDNLVLNMLTHFFTRLDELENSIRFKFLPYQTSYLKHTNNLIDKVIYEQDNLTMVLSIPNSDEKLEENETLALIPIKLDNLKLSIDSNHIYITLPTEFSEHYGQTTLINTATKHPKLEQLIKAYKVRKHLESGMAVNQIASTENIHRRTVAKYLQIAYARLDELKEILGIQA